MLPKIPKERNKNDLRITTPDTLRELLRELEPLPKEHKFTLNASIQRIATIKPKTDRTNVQTNSSYGYALREIEKKIANLDSWQMRGAIEYPEGPQRILGVSGSGKTVVLALKAAFLHAKHPKWNMVVTYYSKALRSHFQELIRAFLLEINGKDPDWTKIQVMHSLGNNREAGVYREIVRQCGVEPMSWKEANDKHRDTAFERICKDVLDHLGGKDLPNPLYDAVLIDESQDLPTAFFQLVYAATSEPKRIVWTYDESQNLSAYAMPSPDMLFGRNDAARPRVGLVNKADRPKQDIVLPICYRNSPQALTLAHGLGFGVYREANDRNETSIVQMFEDPHIWNEIGYEAVSGELELGSQISLQRHHNSTPNYFTDANCRLIEPSEAVEYETFQNSHEQANWIAQKVRNDLDRQELLHQDFLIILPNSWTVSSEFGVIGEALRKKNISSHLVGISSSYDEVFRDNSIAVTHVYRAKGNEAPMVYFVNAHECYDGFQLANKRNKLFTGITRSRAWVRVSGIGSQSLKLQEEFNKVIDSDCTLNFLYPSEDQLKKNSRNSPVPNRNGTRQDG